MTLDHIPENKAGLLSKLKSRFEVNMDRHRNADWNSFRDRLESSPQKLRSLWQMEQTGGEPDIIGFDKNTGEFFVVDCSDESPAGRRSLCYDQEALLSRKANKPADSALHMAGEMGVEILTEDLYRDLQKLGPFDQKTSSWIWTPPKIRELGGAIFADYRYGQVFIYHNGAESYYSSRGFRGLLKI